MNFGKIENLALKIHRIIGRTLIKYSLNPRPSTYPYITGDGFRNFANHIYDKKSRCLDTNKVVEGDIIFIGDQLIDEFLTEIHPRIKSKYTIITHNGDSFIDDKMIALADNKLIKWYGTNMLSKNPKAVPLPIGIENKHFYVWGIPSVFKKVIRKRASKKDKIFYKFTVSTNTSEREPLLTIMTNNKFGETVDTWNESKRYLETLSTYKFVVSPPGSSIEGHRTWEALYLGVIPIVKSSVTTDYFKKLGVPIWQVKDWTELNSLNEKTLQEKYEQLKNGFNSDVLFLDYWTDKIRKAEN